MPNIALLDQNTIDKIAAGEVIERPSSVVKELVENAIDANATAITVEIKEGGISFIRITDNGCGIPREEAALAFLRHSTSKIKRVEDLLCVASLGFRGEALSSIAAVSQVELITKTKESLMGIRYIIEGGAEKELEDIGAPEGTTFLVRKLFYNTPARRKFLKSAVTEASYINDLVERLALSHPDISFKFINNNQTKIHTSGNTNLKDIIYNVYGREIAGNLIELNTEMEGVKITGFIGKPVISRGNRNYENYYVNARYVKSNLISKAIEEGYKTFMMQHKYPFTALHFTIDGDLLDVNVHPTKMELRFSNQEEIYQFIFLTISEGLTRRELIPKVSLSNNENSNETVKLTSAPEPFEKNRLGYKNDNKNENININENSNESKQEYKKLQKTVIEASHKPLSKIDMMFKEAASPYPDTKTDFIQNANLDVNKELISTNNEEGTERIIRADIEAEPIASKAVQLDLFEDKLLTKEAKYEHKMIGQVFDTYWIVQYHDKMYLIDQHAAHEKVLYERMVKSLKSKEHTSQLISPPIILTLSMQEEELVKKYMDSFTRIGFEIESFGGKEYSVRAVPGNLFSIAHKDLLIEMIDSLSENLTVSNPDMIDEKLASMSCKAAVKGNNKLSVLEATALIDELLTLDNPYNCPHGRPTIISMTKSELEKKFKRIV